MSVLKIFNWIMTSNNVITCWVLITFVVSLLFILLRGVRQ